MNGVFDRGRAAALDDHRRGALDYAQRRDIRAPRSVTLNFRAVTLLRCARLSLDIRNEFLALLPASSIKRAAFSPAFEACYGITLVITIFRGVAR